MKVIFRIKTAILLMFVALLSVSVSGATFIQNTSDETITYQDFYDRLSPYGTWIEYPGYGHVWNPRVEGEFRPYLTNGYWDYTDEGWMWTSNYDWGWAPFHYGRWLNDSAYGWLWVPGYEWSPAWVTWGDFDNYYAWAPIAPFVNVGIGFNSWHPDSVYWNVVDRNHIYDRNIYNHVMPRTDIHNYVYKITIINNFNRTSNHNQYYSRGPKINEVERYTEHSIKPVAIHNVKKPEEVMRNENTSHVYRPTVQQAQPRTYKRMENPVVNPSEPPMQNYPSERAEQIRRVQAMPEFRAPENTFGRNEAHVGNFQRKRN